MSFGRKDSKMLSTLARIARPALQRCTSSVACQTVRFCRRPEKVSHPPPARLTFVQLRGQQTLGSASLSVASHSVRHARALDEERLVEVKWEDGGQSLYPFTWLRDNCQCSLCTLQSAQARKLLMSDLDVHTDIDVVEVTNDSKVGQPTVIIDLYYNYIHGCRTNIVSGT